MKYFKMLLVINSIFFVFVGPQVAIAAYYPIIFLHGIGDGSNATGWETWGHPASAMYKIINSNNRGYTAGDPINSNICSIPAPTGGETRKIYNFSYYNVDGAPGVIGSGKLADGRPRLVPKVYDWMVAYQISANGGCWAQYCSTFVERVCQATGASKVDIVSHSMGGLVARSYIKWYGGSSRVHKLITVGCPNHGFQSPFQERIYSQFSGHWQWQKRGEDLEMDVDPSIAGASVTFLDRSNNNVEGRWPDLLGYDQLGVETSTIAGTFSTILIPEHPNDGTVEVSSAHLGGETFRPNVYLNHSLRMASWEELAECTSTFTAEFIKKWMIDEDYSYTGAYYLPRGPVFWSNENGSVWPNTWCTREVRLQPAVSNYQQVLCTQVALHDLENENRIVEYKAFPTYQYTHRILNTQQDHSEGEPVYGKDINAYCDPNRNTIHYVAEIRNYDLNGLIDRERGAHLYVSRVRNGEPCYIYLSTPNGGFYSPGSSVRIAWDGVWKHALRQDIQLTTDGGSSWVLIANVGEDDRSFLWTIPNNICSEACKVSVISWLDVNTPLIGQSANYFSIKPPLPSPPTNVTAQSNDEDLVHLFWVNTYNWAKGFGIWRRVSGGGYPHDPNFYAQYTNRCDDNTAERGTTYYYQIKTQDYCGNWSAASDEVSATTLWLSTPNLDPYRTVAISHNQVHIEFGDPSRYEYGYIIERRIYGSGQQFAEVGRSVSSQPPNEKRNRVEFDDFNNLQSSTKYVYRILGYEGNPPFRYSAFSDTDTVTTRGYLSSTKALATAYNTGRKIVRDDAGKLHLVYTDGSYVNYIKSSDNGYTWSAPEYWMNPVQNDSVFFPAIAVGRGSNPKVYIAYIGWWKTPSDIELKVMARDSIMTNGARWDQIFFHDPFVNPLEHKRWGPPSIMIDDNNRPHVVWQYWNTDPDYRNEIGVYHWWQDPHGYSHLAKLFPNNYSDEVDPVASMGPGSVLHLAYEGTRTGQRGIWTCIMEPPDYRRGEYVLDGWSGVHSSLCEINANSSRCAWVETTPTGTIKSADSDNSDWIWLTEPALVGNVNRPTETYPFLVGNYCVWEDNISNNWEVYYSQKVGDTWSPKVNVSQSPSASSKYPHAVFYQQGRPIYNKYLGVVWTEGNGPPDPYQVKYQSVRLPWDVAYSSSREATGYNNAKRFLADAQGNLYLTYTSKDSVFYISTTNGGDNWSSSLALGPGQSPALNLDLNGNPCATWRKVAGDSLHLYFARRGPSGWSVSEIYSEKAPFIAYISPPSVAIDRADTAHVIFEYSTVGPVGAWKVYYGNFAVSSPRLMPLAILDSLGMAPDSVPVSPSICVDGRGIVHAVWSDLTGEIQYRKRIQGPWSSKVNLSNSSTASYHPTISSWGPVAVAWQEEVTPGTPEIFYRTIGDSLLSPIQNLSNTPSASSAEPIISGSKVLWVENVNGDNEIYQTKFDSETMAWSAPSSVSATEALSTHPQASVSQTEQSTWAYSVWTEEVVPDRAYQILFSGQELPAQPAYALDLGQSEPSPMVVQRDGFIQYGPEPARTVDYDTTELMYHLTNLNPSKRDRILLSFYHESSGDWKMKLEADHVSLGMVHVPSGQEVVFEKWLPPCVYDDGEVTLRIKRERGDFAVLGKLLVYEYAHGGGGGGPQSAEGALPAPLPTVFGLAQSYPNPMRDNATIRYQLPVETQVSLKVYNVIGQVVRELASGKQKAGYYKAVWDSRDGTGRSVSSGVYFYRLDAGGYSKTNKLVILR